MSFDNPKRFDRIVAIFIQLQSKRVVKAHELAERFQVSLRTIYRDIRSLEASGVPIFSEAGIGYSLMEGYRLPPVRFTREEAGSFVAAEKLMQKFTDKTLGAYFESALFKVKSVLRGSEKDWITALESQVFINPSQSVFNDKIPNALELLFESIVEKKQVLLHYESLHADKVTERLLEVVGVFHENNYWYVMAYCHLRQDYRQFRIDRMLGIKRTEKAFTKEHGTVDEYRVKDEYADKTRVRLLVDKKVIKYIRNSRNYYGFMAEKIKGTQVEMTFMCSDVENAFSRWYIMFGDYAQIIEPESLKIRVREIIRNMEAKLQLGDEESLR